MKTSGIDNISILGPGKTTLEFSPKQEESVLAFQEVFPNCLEYLGIVPDYWVCGDPNAYMVGMRYLLENTTNHDLKKNKILIPNIFMKDIACYRKYCGATPLIRSRGGWDEFRSLTEEIMKNYNVEVIPVTTMKYLKVFNQNRDLQNINQPGFEFLRFMQEKVVFGTVEFDSEFVVGDRYKWGLENKLTSVALPVCYYLGAKKVKTYGFDYRGPRFYSDVARHPWNDETQSGNSAVEFSLSLLQKWLQWESIHGMKIVSGTRDSISLPNKFLEYES